LDVHDSSRVWEQRTRRIDENSRLDERFCSDKLELQKSFEDDFD
jgi:hypothetical protein